MLWIVFSSKPMLRSWSRGRCAAVIDVYTPVMIPSKIVFVLCWAWISIKCTVLRATLYGPRFVVILFRHRSAIGAVISTDIYVLIHSAHWVPSTKYVLIYQLSACVIRVLETILDEVTGRSQMCRVIGEGLHPRQGQAVWIPVYFTFSFIHGIISAEIYSLECIFVS